ncbi:hypothetical protein BBN63_00615 [Streptomyces niveus]|uniref:Uncharacterized protein n=1 Tax=Streptomyces niveus TaxID=193462 RepID=A0A1U9QMU6_STRNV|nr:hypothetical protein BBN63_00615 [Streptomyces niveus]
MRAVSWERLGRPRKTRDCFFSRWASIWAILSSAPARLVGLVLLGWAEIAATGDEGAVHLKRIRRVVG